jgi:alpha-L-arabinofuranosidase
MTANNHVIRTLAVSGLAVFLTLNSAGAEAPAGQARLVINTSQPGAAISPTLYGIFFEDINCSADGGIYPELVRNRSFEDADQPEHWKLTAPGGSRGEISISHDQPRHEHNRKSLEFRILDTAGGAVGVANDGFWGMAFKAGAAYDFTLIARSGNGFTGPLEVSLAGSDGRTYAKGQIEGLTADWRTYKLTLKATADDPQGRLVISSRQTGTVWMDWVSLFPQTTWKGRANGLRPDLANMLDGLKPSFMRFPGGCWVEGDTMPLAYRWKQTVGDLSTRRTQYNIWRYNATHGLGFHEYLQLSEDLGAEPLFVINCGMSHRENIPMNQMGPFVQDALDAIEYANGPASSQWGAVRAKNGHPEPFHLKYMEIGNENGGPAYIERYALFHDAIKARYPGLQLVANDWGGVPTNRPIEIIDEHYYNNPEFFINQAHRYDTYDRHGPKIYVGEYAVTSGCGQGNLRAAIGEAAFMTGMERNSDVVVLASYAPLFANVNYKKWNPDLINFDSAHAYGIPSYHVQKMFSENRGDFVLPAELTFETLPPPPPLLNGVGVGTWETQAEYKDLRLTTDDTVLFETSQESQLADWTPQGAGGNWSLSEGVIKQSQAGADFRLVKGNPQWKDYTFSLKARKLSGAEGFLILFQVQDDNHWIWWNLGGWGNSRHALERCDAGGKRQIGNPKTGRIETNRWYDIRIECRGRNLRCFLDGNLIDETTFTLPKITQPKPLYAVASRVKTSGEVVVKMVNVSTTHLETSIDLPGISALEPSATAWVLTSAKPTDENTIAEPTKVAPVSHTITTAAIPFKVDLPGNSVTVLRLKPRSH